MENATDALLMAFAILIFIIALSVTLTTLSQAKSTADIVLFYSDRENFQSPIQYDPEEYQDGGRDVNVDTVISTIYRCAKEKFSVKISDGTEEYVFEYDTQTAEQLKKQIDKFIKEHKGNTYRETYVEVTTGGKTYNLVSGEQEEYGIIIGDDETLEQDVVKKIYITYEKQS